MFNTYLYQPLFDSLVWLTSALGNFGLSIIIFTIILRLLLLPLTLPSLKAAAKMRQLQPEINQLKAKFKNDKTKLQQAQIELFQQHKLNPAAGCLPQIIQLVILIALYQVFMNLLQDGHPAISSTSFAWLDLTRPDPLYILPILSGVSQLILGFMLLPATDTTAVSALAASTPTLKDDQKADDLSQMAVTMQQQMLYLMPFMTGFIALTFPSGLALYWVISTVASIIQQYIFSGPGGLLTLPAKLSSLGQKLIKQS